MGRVLTIILIAVLLPCARLSAQPVSYPFHRIDTRDGLSHNEINAIFKDSRGFMWFGTISGLNRYDGHDFRVFLHDPSDSSSIAENTVRNIMDGPGHRLWVQFMDNSFNIYDPGKESFIRDYAGELRKLGIPDPFVSNIVPDNAGNYWFVHPSLGLYRYNTATKKTTHVLVDGREPRIATDNIADFTFDYQGHYWVIRRSGLLESVDTTQLKLRFSSNAIQQAGQNLPQGYNLYADAQGDLWIYCSQDARGIWYFRVSDGSVQHIDKSHGACRLNNDIVRDVLQDNSGLMWIGTDHGGVNLLDKRTMTMRYLEHRDFDENSLSQNAITRLYKDNTGTVWLGTYKQGLNVYFPGAIRFPVFRHHPTDPSSLGYDDVNRFVEDARGNLWIGTNGGGLIYFDRKSGKFTSYVHQAGNPNSPSNDVIISLCVDHEGKLWIGSYFGGLDCFDGRSFTHYRHNEADNTSLADDRVWEIFEDKWNQLWVGTLAAGLDLVDREHHRFIHHRSEDPNHLVYSNYISELTQDTAGNLWIGTAFGISELEHRTGRYRHFAAGDGLNGNAIVALRVDSMNRVWAGTSEGLNLFDPVKGKVLRTWNKGDGLPDNYILTIAEDNMHNLWMGTPNGLCNAVLEPVSGSRIPKLQFLNYDESSGLQSRQFNENAAWKTREGEMVFGGPSGFNIFRPENIAVEKETPALVFTNLQVFNRNIVPGEPVKGRPILQVALPETQEISLRYDENVFAISFADLNYSGNAKTTYAYRLENFNQDWLLLPNQQRSATFTNLDPGTYTFRIRAVPSEGKGTPREASLVIHILPPFWKTPVAFVLYILSVIAILALARKILVERTRMRFRIEQERKEAQNMHELDMMKIRFFTNVSHEFRTPLSLILTPLEKLIKPGAPAELHRQYLLMYRNARRLLNLVNQLLDFRKMEVQEFTLHRSPGNIVAYVRDLTQSFSDISEKRNISLSFTSNSVECTASFDKDKLEKIVFNLLSNAFKFTQEGGSVKVAVLVPGPGRPLPDADSAEQDIDPYLEIRVSDTGIGIPADQQERIFERFFQHDLPGNMINQGSGIGLALTREFVKLHGGTITVQSEPEKGSCFIVRLPVISIPVKAIAAEATTAQDLTISPRPETGNGLPEEEHRKTRKPVVLLVEDNEDFRFYLKDNLRVHFQIVEAANGREGWGKVQAVQPDLVVSDIMMPEMDGIALARRIKNDARTSHIPVILLTARADEEQQLEGYATGANDYITKPFNFELLLARVRNLLAERKATQKQFQKHVEVNPSPVDITPLDEQFLKQAVAAVEQRLSDPEFSVEDLSRALHFSRVTLYKKLSSLTGKAPLDFIRHIRLKRAAELLAKSQMTVAEIAYEVGFNNPKYFARYFRKEYGVQPSAYKQQKKASA